MKLDRLTLQYSNLYQHGANQVKISPNAQYVANAVDSRLVIRDHVKDLSILMVYQSAASTLDYIEWSPSSEYILAVDTSQSRIDVWSTLDSHWHAVFKDPRIETIQKVKWSSDSQHILYTADLNVRKRRNHTIHTWE